MGMQRKYNTKTDDTARRCANGCFYDEAAKLLYEDLHSQFWAELYLTLQPTCNKHGFDNFHWKFSRLHTTTLSLMFLVSPPPPSLSRTPLSMNLATFRALITPPSLWIRNCTFTLTLQPRPYQN